MKYFVKPVVCDYGIYRVEDKGERKLIDICNSLSNAEMVAKILNSDAKHEVWSRPTGEWIRFRSEEHQPFHIKCSNCGQYWSIDVHSKIFKYCFNCGAKMKEGEEEK